MATRAIQARDDGVMLVEHRGKRPTVHESAWVAPTAVICGDVHVGEDARVMWNAVVSAEDGRVEVRIGAVVHVNSTVTGVVPIGWVAVGDRMFPPDRDEEIWAIQEGLDFPGTVYGEPRGEDLMARVMPRQTAWLGAHRDDRVI